MGPTFLDAMPEVKKKIRQPCVAVVTTDEVWNTFVKLRMDRVYKGSVEGTGSELLKSNEMIAADAFPPVDKAKWTAPYNKYAAGWGSVLPGRRLDQRVPNRGESVGRKGHRKI